MTEIAKKRPEFRNINAFSDLPSYRLPAAGWVSILHRVSGVVMFVLLPFIIWMFDNSISSEYSFARFRSAFNQGIGYAPGWFLKLVVLGLIWAYLHHFIAGLRTEQRFAGMDVWIHGLRCATKNMRGNASKSLPSARSG